MMIQTVDEKERWITEIKDHSRRLIEFITTGQTKKDSITHNWVGSSILNEIDSFIQGKTSKVTGVVKLWKKHPIVVLRFPGEITKPIKMKWTVVISVPFSHPSLKHEEYKGWFSTETTPDWLKRFLAQFLQRITQAKQNFEKYLPVRNDDYKAALENPETLEKYQQFLEHHLSSLKYLKNKYNEYYSSHPSRYNPPLMPNQISRIHLGYDPDFSDYLDSKGRKIQNSVQTIYEKIDTLLQNGEITKKEHSYAFPSDFSELGAAKARTLGFISNKASQLEEKVEWSAMHSEPYFWFQPLKSDIHNITTINWNEILDLTQFEEEKIIEGVHSYIPNAIPDYFEEEYFIDEDDAGWIKKEYSPRIPIDFNAIIDETYGTGYYLEEINKINFRKNEVSGKIPLKKWLKQEVQSLKESEQQYTIFLDPIFFSEIPDFPSTCVVIIGKERNIFLDHCWRSLEEKNKTQMMKSLQQKYAAILQKPLDFLFEDAPSQLEDLQAQVGVVVENVVQIEKRLQEATKSLLELAGGWTPTWLEKDIYVLQQVLEKSLGKELPRKELLQQWHLWLKERKMYRSIRELRYNLRGLERTKILENYRIHIKQGLSTKKGAKPSIFFLKPKVDE